MTVTFLSRAQWGAGGLGSGHRVAHEQFVGLVAHHTVMVMPDYDRDGFLHGDLDDVIRYMQQLQHARPDLGDEVPYSFVVFEGARPGDCIVAEGRGWGVTGAHTAGYNSTRYGVALAGNSSTRPVTAGVLSGYRWVGARLAKPRNAVRTLGHRDTKATECPGASLYAALPKIQPPFEEDDLMPALTDPEQRELLRLLRQVHAETAGAPPDSRLAEVTLLTRGLAGVDPLEPSDLAAGGDARPHLKTLVQGAVLDGLRKPDAEHPDRGVLRPVFVDLVREAMAPAEEPPPAEPTG